MNKLFVGYEDAAAHNSNYTGYFVVKNGERTNIASLTEVKSFVEQHLHWGVEVSYKGWGNLELHAIADCRREDLEYMNYLNWDADK